jgi:CBS domain-containing protein
MPDQTPVTEVMTRDVVTLAPDTAVASAADVLAGRGIGAAPVVDASGKLVGLLRDEDLILQEAQIHVPTALSFLGTEFFLPTELRKFDRELRKAVAATAGEIMTTDFETVGPNATLEDVATLMHDRAVTHVPVVDDSGKIVGIVARGDIIRFLARTT